MPFQPGNKLAQGGARHGAGRKSIPIQQEFEYSLQNVLTTRTRKAILKKITESALHGDLRAAAFLFNNAYGRPAVREEQPAVQALAEEEEEEPCDMSRLTDAELDVFIYLLNRAKGKIEEELPMPAPLKNTCTSCPDST